MTDIDISKWNFPSNVVLADRDFNKPAPTDILLGAETFSEILLNGRYDYNGLPVLQNTKLGYILSGKFRNSYVKQHQKKYHSLFVQGKLHTCHALLDCGSQSNFITESTVRRLGLEQIRNQIPITGINNAISVTNYKVNLEITSMKSDYTNK